MRMVSPIPSINNMPSPTADLTVPPRAAGLGDARWRGCSISLVAIGLDRHEDFGGFHADLEILKVVPIQNINVTQGRLH